MSEINSLYNLYKKHPSICTDTRKIEPGCLFFALKGPNFNANEFAKDALEKGAAYAIIDEPTFKISEQFIVVNDVLTTLQQLATFHREQLNIPVLAIVGSNGKTTTKELITAVLSTEKKVLSTPGNFNNHIGLPLTLLMLNETHEIAVIEMGANHVGENALLCDIAKPTCGLITNNGKDHLEGFGSIEGVAQSNSELYYYLLKNKGTAFVNANDEWLMRMASRLTQKITFAANDSHKNATADVAGLAEQLQPHIVYSFNGKKGTSHLSGDYNFDNIMAAVCAGTYFNIKDENIINGIAGYEPKNNRSQLIKTDNNTIYLDAYNANPSSMEASLKNFSAMPFHSKIAVIGDMFELGKYSDEEHRNMIRFCMTLNLEEVFFVGKEFERNQIPHLGFHYLSTTDEASQKLQALSIKGKTVFIKGSRGVKLETLVACFN